MTDLAVDTVIDTALIPDGYVAILEQNRVFPVERILDVQANLAGGTTIWLEGGREVLSKSPINDVMRAIAASRPAPVDLTAGLAAKPEWAPLRVDGIDVVPLTDDLLEQLRGEHYFMANELAPSAAQACPSRPNVTRLATMKRGGITSTTTCVHPKGHGTRLHGERVCTVVVGPEGLAPGQLRNPDDEYERSVIYTLIETDRA